MLKGFTVHFGVLPYILELHPIVWWSVIVAILILQTKLFLLYFPKEAI